ncbi:MAG: hypothetical protein QOH90_2300, partial [Actinomycetota bacterium]|nr:hypothetical protein [Actinomycetota bacterium]
MFQGLRRLGGLTLAIVLVVATPSAQLRRAEAGAGGVTENFEVVGHLSFPGPTPEGDIALFDYGGDVGNHAFIGAWREPCTGKPVRIVDVSDPTQPRVVGRADSGEGTSSEDVVVRRIGDRVVLATGIQACFHHGRHGLALFDVTDPANPRHLSFTSTPGHGVHELDVVVRPDGRALALLATPYTEFTFPGSRKTTSGEFRIVDITHPKNPVRLADWGIQRDSNLTMFDTGEPVKGSLQGLGYYPAHFGHSVRAVDDGDTAYVSYWDGGVLKFDISEPSKPLLIGRTTFPPDADGDAHSMTTYDVGGERYIFQNDEDFDPLAPAKITANVSGDVFYGLEQHPMPALLTETGETTSSFHDAKNGCDPDMRGAQDQIVIASVPP